MNIIAKTKITETFYVKCETEEEYIEAIDGLKCHFGSECEIKELKPKNGNYAKLKASTSESRNFEYSNIYSIGQCGRPIN